eukprot:SAG31_NODE_20723_length_566_cov_86.612420_1_plen_123_part_10
MGVLGCRDGCSGFGPAPGSVLAVLTGREVARWAAMGWKGRLEPSWELLKRARNWLCTPHSSTLNAPYIDASGLQVVQRQPSCKPRTGRVAAVPLRCIHAAPQPPHSSFLAVCPCCDITLYSID